MENITGRLIRLFWLLFIAVTGYITWFTFTQWDRAGFLYPLLSAPERVLVIAAGVLLLAVLTGIFCRFSRNMNKKQERIFAAAILLILFLGQTALIAGIGQSTFMYDPYRVFDEALHMLTTHTVSGTAMEGYYGIYPNNIPFTLLCYWILRISSAFGLQDPGLMLLLQIINALCMDLAVWLTFRLLSSYVSPAASRLFLFFCLINPLVYLWPGFVYTSTVSMPFIMGGLSLFLKLFHSASAKSRIRSGLLLGPVLVLGFKIRATVLITLIAGILYFLLCCLGRDVSPAAGEEAADASAGRMLRPTASLSGSRLPGFLALVFSLALSFGAWGLIQQSYVGFDSTDTAFPVVSWLAMGVEGDGMFNTQDYYDTKNAPTAAEKKEINGEKLRSRLQELGISGWLQLAGRKMVRTWADGTDDYVSYLNQYADAGKLHTYLLEDKKDFIVCYMQMMRCFLFLLVLLGTVFLFFQKDRHPGALLLLSLNLAGGTFFHVLWETGELYSLCFSFLLFALAAAGFEQLWVHCPGQAQPQEFPKAGKVRYLPAAALLILLAVTAGWLFSRTGDFTRTTVKKHDSVISQKTYTSAAQPGLTKGNTLEQTFSTDKPFNRVCVRVKNVLPEQKDSEYQVMVSSEGGDILLSRTVTGNDVFDYDYFYFGLDTEASPETLTRYTITITCLKGTKDSSIAFLRYDTGNHDAYLPGTLKENGTEVPNGDLNFMVYRSYEDTYLSPGTWRILSAGLLIFELLLLAYCIRAPRSMYKKGTVPPC